jgi:hypothetical protein
VTDTAAPPLPGDVTTRAAALWETLDRLPGERSMNVAVAGSITMYDRHTRGSGAERRTA